MEREIHQTVAQSQSGGVSGLNRVCAGVKGEGGECVWGCVCVCVRGDEKRKGVESVDVQRRKSVRRRRRCWSGRPSVEMEEGGGKVAGDSECISGGRVHV